jgi:hypothetical protein
MGRKGGQLGIGEMETVCGGRMPEMRRLEKMENGVMIQRI